MEYFKESYPTINVDQILSSKPTLLFIIRPPNPLEFLSAAHGVRTVDNLRIYCGIDDPEKLEARKHSLTFISPPNLTS